MIPAPGTGRDPWEKDRSTQNTWQLGLSLMNRQAQLTPTAWHPVLAQKVLSFVAAIACILPSGIPYNQPTGTQ
ncbi:hypothetical protein [Paraflavitalea speifideaquila]|uniref:hypothetical protein n=1 Tax=Paraflavitalea speifideaquila TaxID=3076558 RepID=UPI0028EFC8E8|nr:hypothetical protein [Paraflavitalea speifideiaquila]